MNNCVLEIFQEGGEHSRQELTLRTGMTDRRVRREIRNLRREGEPIMALPSGGYKLAETEEEIRQLLDMLEHYAADALRTRRMLCKRLNVEGQYKLTDGN